MSLKVKNLNVPLKSFQLEIPLLEIKKAEIVGVLGKSGSGKSTLLSALGGFVPLSSGEIEIEGEDRTSFFPEQRRLAYVFQKSALFPQLSVERNVAFPLVIQKKAKADYQPQVKHWMSRLGIGHLAERMPHEISGGEAQRVALARALVSGFGVALFDEPFSALDPALRRELRKTVKELIQETSLSVLWVTHDLADLELFSRVYVLDLGKIAWHGPANEVPKERFF